MGVYLNPGNEKFTIDTSAKIYVDKTGMIAYCNEVLSTPQRLVLWRFAHVTPIKGRMPSNQTTTWHYYEKVIISNAITYFCVLRMLFSLTYVFSIINFRD